MQRNIIPPNYRLFKPELIQKPRLKVIKTDIWVEYWNLQPGLRKHKAGFKTYRQSAQMVHQLMEGLSARRWDQQWLGKNKIQQKFLQDPWPPVAIKRAMRTLSAMTEPGMWPGPNTWLSQLDLSSAIYNPRSCTSMMVYARCQQTPSRLFHQQNKDSWDRATPQALAVAAPLREAGIQIWAEIAEKLARQYNILSGQDPMFIYLAGGLEGFGRMLTRWLQEQNQLSPGKKIQPPDGYLWRQFVKTFSGGANG